MAAIVPRIQNLKTTAFGGRRFTRRQLARVEDLVNTFPVLSRQELAQTLCEQVRWSTPTGQHHIKAGLQMIKNLEECDIVTLPPPSTIRRSPVRASQSRTPRAATLNLRSPPA